MIYLTTGVPGAGKSLYTLCEVKALAEKENRTVYYDGIKDLRIPGWIAIADAGLPAGADRENAARYWMHLPAGSIIVIDECQRIFRPRGVGSAVPDYVAELETHRHKGFDLFLITQHPMLIDSNVRRLVGLHRHVQRAFGMHRATIHEWQNGVREQPDKSRTDSVRREFKYPPEAFAFYKSAEVHTHKRRIPPRVFFLLVAPVLIAVLLWGFYAKMKGYATGEATAERIKHLEKGGPSSGSGVGAVPGGAARGAAKLTRAEWLDERMPRLGGLDYTAPIYDEVVKPVYAPHPAACIQSRSRGCECFTDQGTRLAVAVPVCEQIVEKGFFVAWDVKEKKRPDVAPAPRQDAPQRHEVPVVTLDEPPRLSPSWARAGASAAPVPDGGGPSTNPRLNPAVRPQ